MQAMYNHLEKSSRPCFRGMLEMEAGKFDKNNETFVNVDGVRYRKESAGEFKSIDNEYSVVMTSRFSVHEMPVCYYTWFRCLS